MASRSWYLVKVGQDVVLRWETTAVRDSFKLEDENLN